MFSGPPPFPLLLTLLAANGAAFLLFAEDKRRAVAGAWRIPESSLIIISIIGPFGAFAAMRVLRHKTQKLKFFIAPLSCILQVLIFLWLLAGSA